MVTGFFFIFPMYFIVEGVGYLSGPPAPLSEILSLAIFSNSLMQGLGSGAIATATGFAYAWIIYRSDTPGKRIFEALPLLGLTVPLLFKVFAWIFLLGPRVGLINLLLTRIGLPQLDIHNIYGVIFVTFLDAVPIAFLIARAPILSMDSAMEDASRVAGESMLRTLFKITIPILIPTVLSSFLLLSLLTMSFIEGPLLLGYRTINTFSTAVYYAVNQTVPPRYDLAAQFGIVNIGLTLLFFSAYIYVTRGAYKFVAVTGKATSQLTPHRLGKWKVPMFIFCVVMVLMTFVVPVGGLMFSSMITRGTILNPTFGLSNYVSILNNPDFVPSIENSLILGVVVSLASTGLSILMVYAAVKGRVRGSSLVDLLINMPLAIPAIVYGFALLLMFLFTPGLDALYGSIFPMFLAVTFLYLPTSSRIIASNLIQISDELEEASRVSGAGWWNTFVRIPVALIRRGLVSSVLRALLDAMRELGSIILLSTPGSLVVAYLLFTIFNSQASDIGIVAAGSMIVTFIMAGLLAVLIIAEKYA